MPRRKRGNAISGFVLVDKPEGPTSNQVLQRVRRLFDARKAGHTGTLDPLATGMLPICLGEATKTAALAIQADKHYTVTGKLGAATDTADAMGEVVETAPVPQFDADAAPAAIAAVLDEFIGEIEQVPPRYSAVRHEGKRLYELARAGVEVPRRARRITIHGIKLLDVSLPEFSISVSCSKGTYVRTLVEDVAQRLGSLAHVTELRRTAVGPFVGAAMVTPEQLEAEDSPQARIQKHLLPVDYVLTDWPRITVTMEAAGRLRQGQKILLNDAPQAGRIRVYDDVSSFIGIGEVSGNGELFPKRIFL